MSGRTYGDKPISFQVEEGGEFYCIGSEVSELFWISPCTIFVVVMQIGILIKNLQFLPGRFVSQIMPRLALQKVSWNAQKNIDKRGT